MKPNRAACLAGLTLLCGLLSGCGLLLDPYNHSDDASVGMDAGSADGGSRDAGARDATPIVDAPMVLDGGAPDAPACVPSDETCNGEDDDCDTLIDEEPAAIDEFNCGFCGNVCPIDEPFCIGGRCGFLCAPGTEDCDEEPGCETDIRLAEHCGDCGTVCEGGAVCEFIPGTADWGCSGTCRPGRMDCGGGECVDVLADSRHCGGCDVPCPGGAPHCNGGNCLPCPSGLDDCNDDPLDGCETPLDTRADCGSCGETCDGPCPFGACLVADGT
ncbi:MAG: hypothetical protein AB8I08_07235 [Sandaracinaceae bacterium]